MASCITQFFALLGRHHRDPLLDLVIGGMAGFLPREPDRRPFRRATQNTLVGWAMPGKV